MRIIDWREVEKLCDNVGRRVFGISGEKLVVCTGMRGGNIRGPAGTRKVEDSDMWNGRRHYCKYGYLNVCLVEVVRWLGEDVVVDMYVDKVEGDYMLIAMKGDFCEDMWRGKGLGLAAESDNLVCYVPIVGCTL